MKKFILLFAMTIVILSVVEAQRITKIYGQDILGSNKPWVNFGTDTLQYTPTDNLKYNVNIRLAVVYENGSTALAKDDIIVLDLKIATSSIFKFDGDSLHYELTEDLAANDTLWIDLSGTNYESMVNYSNSFMATSNDNLGKISMTATVFRTSKFTVPTSNRNKTVDAYFLKTAGGSSSLIEKAIQNVQLFPNPVNSSLNITNLSNTKVEIFNVVGQRILTYGNAYGNLNVDMAAYPNGIYFVKMQNGKSVRTEKIKLVK